MIKLLGLSELQKAIYDEIISAGYRCYDDASLVTEPLYPYVILGDKNAVDFSTKITSGEEDNIIVNIYSTYNGSLEVEQMISGIMQRLSNQPLNMTNFALVHRTFEFVTIINEQTSDGREIRHGVLKYRFKIEQV